MKDATFSPVFASMYCGLCDISRKNGYALAVHGTMNLDFDLVAIPWTDQAICPRDLAQTFAEHLRLFDEVGFEKFHEKPEVKPHGRLSWILYFGSHAYIDFSVMPISHNVVDEEYILKGE